MTSYEFFKFLHVLFAVAWIGGAIAVQVFALRSKTSSVPGAMKHYADVAGWMGPHYFAPIAGLTVVWGVILVVISSVDFSDAWVLIGIVLYAITFLTGMLYLKPQGEKIAAGMETLQGPPSSDLQERIRRVEMIGRIDLVLLIAIIADMVIKPGA